MVKKMKHKIVLALELPTAKIVEAEIQRQHVKVVVDLFRERIGQASEPAIAHADVEVHALHI